MQIQINLYSEFQIHNGLTGKRKVKEHKFGKKIVYEETYQFKEALSSLVNFESKKVYIEFSGNNAKRRIVVIADIYYGDGLVHVFSSI